MSRSSLLVNVGVYALITALAGVFWGLVGAIVVDFLSAIVLIVGFTAHRRRRLVAGRQRGALRPPRPTS